MHKPNTEREGNSGSVGKGKRKKERKKIIIILEWYVSKEEKK